MEYAYSQSLPLRQDAEETTVVDKARSGSASYLSGPSKPSLYTIHTYVCMYLQLLPAPHKAEHFALAT